MASRTGILQIEVNGSWVSLYDPQTMEWQIADIDAEEGTGRNQKGKMQRSRVATKRKLVCSFPPLTATECSTQLKLVSPAMFNLRYPDALTGAKRTATFYVGDRKAPTYVLGDGASNPTKWLWRNVGFDFIEV